MRNARFAGLALVTSILIALTGCGGDDGGGGGQGVGQEAAPQNAKTLNPDQARPEGTINWCIGKDTSGTYKIAVENFNKQNPGAKARLRELPESADEQRTQLVQRLRAKSPDCDVLGLDVIWTAEFAAQNWLYDVSPVIEQRRDEFVASTLDSAKYADKHWAIPFNSNAGFLYRRTDQVEQAPATWQDVYEAGKKEDGVVYQGARYEGLTVHFLELLYSRGGRVLSDDGKRAEVNSPEAREVLQFMVDGIKNDAVPRAVTTYKEEEARRAFESERASLMRNWPYAYALAQESDIADDFDISPLPAFGEGQGEGAGVLGGFNLGISAFSQNAEGALAFANYLAGEEFQVITVTKGSSPPVLRKTYENPKVRRALPFADQMLQAIEQAKPRPVSPVYSQVSQAIYENVHEALTGRTPPEQALQAMQTEIDEALKTF